MPDAQLSARALEPLLGEWRGTGAHYQALADRIRLLVLDGRIPIDTRLPAERDLAARLELSRTTVSAAYRELRDAGFVASLRGSGTLTRLPGPVLVPAPAQAEGLLDFSKAALPAATTLAAAARAAAEELPHFLADSGYDPVGLPHLRETIAERYRMRGLPTDADQILVTVGAQQAIALIARTLLSRGDRALIEMPTYPHAYEALRSAGARLVPVTVVPADGAARGVRAMRGMRGDDASGSAGVVGGSGSAGGRGSVGARGSGDDGWDPDAIEQAIARSNPTLAYVIPDFHNPTGASMSVTTRERLLAAAAGHGMIVVADETTADLDIDRAETFGPLGMYGQGRAGDAPVIHIGSASKSLWGGLRIGWIRAERATIRRLIAAKPANDLGTPIIEQLVVARMLPDMGSIMEERRGQLRAGREDVRMLVSERFPEWTMPAVDGGLAAWVGIGAPISSQLALGARNNGLSITAGPRFGFDGAFERFLRIPITYSAGETARAFDALAAAWAAVLRHPIPDTGYLADVV
ncbi:PLP-dependent aminotransferase family protein [Diaminobutyricibacter tongyongensis]|uniref:PLP-dependent aminotransferase family protein n=1 Tax=Leifsonia tongyongensis TaxID=1268043 RepID=A0A6L9XU54_9MICO|nr:PLP-dependent aminotransferase family protein [Diaminobutyricibacter tongyongensis]NEN04846.1 PLP-dependent aminotransferase family protein [Diaminobutyricibacter tongyongensis]